MTPPPWMLCAVVTFLLAAIAIAVATLKPTNPFSSCTSVFVAIGVAGLGMFAILLEFQVSCVASRLST